jgi:hypothetical protein
MVTAKIGEQTKDIQIVAGILEPIDVTIDDGIFDLGTTNEENDTILGFSNSILENPTPLKGFTALDFSAMDGIKYIGKNCKFSPSVFDI